MIFWWETNLEQFYTVLGPKRSKDIPFEVYDSDNRVSSDTEEVLGKWKSDFEALLNQRHDKVNVDETFYTESLRDKQRLEAELPQEENRVLNGPILQQEVQRAVTHSKK